MTKSSARDVELKLHHWPTIWFLLLRNFLARVFFHLNRCSSRPISWTCLCQKPCPKAFGQLVQKGEKKIILDVRILMRLVELLTLYVTSPDLLAGFNVSDTPRSSREAGPGWYPGRNIPFVALSDSEEKVMMARKSWAALLGPLTWKTSLCSCITLCI